MLLRTISEALAKAFTAHGLDGALGRAQWSSRFDGLQCNGIMAAGLKGAQAQELATRIAETVSQHGSVHKATVAGPGFINIHLSQDALANVALTAARDITALIPKADTPHRIVIDFGGPNIAKPMHVGHLRSCLIGDCLQRLARALGHQVTSDIHLGDWGLPMGMLVDALARAPIPDLTLDALNVLYPQAAQACKQDEARLDAARRATARLQQKQSEAMTCWQQMLDVTIAGLREDLDRLGVRFDRWDGEATTAEDLPGLTEHLQERVIARVDDGALIVPTDLEDTPPLILRTRDGLYSYAATDLATIARRNSEVTPDYIWYVVDERQHLHFAQIFAAARKAQIAPAEQALEHIGFGTVNGPDGKPFKTREGGVMRLRDLLDNAYNQAQTRVGELRGAGQDAREESQDIAHAVGLAAIKYADLSNYRRSDYRFDLARFMTFEGRTGPYLLYAAVRMASILRKAQEEDIEKKTRLEDLDTQDFCDNTRTLAITIARLPDALNLAFDRRAPSDLCSYAYDLAQAFSAFYTNVPVLTDDERRRRKRLVLVRATHQALTCVLGLLGIKVIDRM
ncbi:MAG: arginine--tRNA ligase [Pseudomonadota bacterium]